MTLKEEWEAARLEGRGVQRLQDHELSDRLKQALKTLAIRGSKDP